MPEGRREQILEAAYACVARWGLSKTTVEDVARQAGVARATVYRYFPKGREELVDAVVDWQQLEFFGRLYEEVHGAESLEDLLVVGLSFARRALVQHEVLQKVLDAEPEVLLPKLTFGATRTLAMVGDFLRPHLAHRCPAELDGRAASDYLARMILSLISSPGRWDLDDPDQVRALVHAELLGALHDGRS